MMSGHYFIGPSVVTHTEIPNIIYNRNSQEIQLVQYTRTLTDRTDSCNTSQ